ncbi:MAG: hypothetical protein ACOX3M_01800 [Saccharofermentanales bacterium]
MNFHRLGHLVLTMILLLCFSACSMFPPESTSPPTETTHQESSQLDESSILGNLKLPPETKNSKRLFEKKNNALTLSAEYQDLSLNQVLDFMDSLSQEQWFLRNNSAFKGSTSLDLSYSTETKQLSLDFTRKLDQAEWPDVLPPYLSYTTPVFGYGRFVSSEKPAIPHTDSAVTLIFEEVTAAQIAEYENLLIDSGYVFDGVKKGLRVYEKDAWFVRLGFQDQKGLATLIIGQFEIDAAPPPPWPDPLPEPIKRKLAAVLAKTTVIETEDGFTATAEEMSLFDLHDFLKALMGRYGWSELTDENEMVHADAGLVLKIVTFSTDNNILIFTLSGSGIEASP